MLSIKNIYVGEKSYKYTQGCRVTNKKKDAYKENMNAPLVKITFLYIFMYVCSYYNKLRRRAYMYVCIYV